MDVNTAPFMNTKITKKEKRTFAFIVPLLYMRFCIVCVQFSLTSWD